jgi:hypothetical protein
MPFFMGVQFAKSGLENGYGLKSVSDAADSITNPMLDMSMLQWVTNAIDTVSYSDNKLVDLALNSLVGYATQGLTSTLLGQFERTAEGTRMTTYTDKNKETSTNLQYLLGKASAKTPGLDYGQIQ